MKQRIAVLITSVIAIVAVVLMSHAALAQTSGSSSSTQIPNKLQALYATATAQAKVAATSPHASKPAILPTMTTSCPQTYQATIVPAHMESNDLMHTYSFTNGAGFKTSSGKYYEVIAGSLLNDTSKGDIL